MNISIEDKAILVDLNVGMPGNQRTDKKLTAEIHLIKHMSNESGEYKKLRLPRTALAPFQKLQNEARIYLNSQTLLGPFGSFRILPTTIFMPVMEKMREYRKAYESLIYSDFVAKYGEFEAWAKKHHNGEFNPADYPGASVEATKFYFKVVTAPVPTGNDMARVNLGNEAIKALISDTDSRIQEAIAQAEADLWKRLAKPVQALIDKMKACDASDRFNIHKTITGNIKEICDLIPVLNLTDNAELDALRQEAESVLCSIDVEELKDSDTARDDARRKAEEIMSKLNGYI
jgi:hypothetical protein